MSPTTGPPSAPPLDEAPHSVADCALAFAVPTRYSEFERAIHARDGRGRDFVPAMLAANPGRTPASIWADYAPMADYARTLLSEAAVACALAVSDVTFARWSQLFRERPVLVLFAHCRPGRPDAVEFADGLVPAPEVARAVPPDFSGVIDFTVCYSLELYAAVKTRASHCQLVLNKGETALNERLAFLRQVLRLLAGGCYSYPAATAEVRLALIRGGFSR